MGRTPLLFCPPSFWRKTMRLKRMWLVLLMAALTACTNNTTPTQTSAPTPQPTTPVITQGTLVDLVTAISMNFDARYTFVTVTDGQTHRCDVGGVPTSIAAGTDTLMLCDDHTFVVTDGVTRRLGAFPEVAAWYEFGKL